MANPELGTTLGGGTETEGLELEAQTTEGGIAGLKAGDEILDEDGNTI